MKKFMLAKRVVEPTSRSIAAGGRVTRLRPQCWEVLIYLVEHRGEVVAIDTLLETIWVGGIGDPAYVRKAIHEIRTALHDAEGRIIKTLPKAGYIIEPETVDERVPTEEISSSPPSPGETLVYGRLSSNAYEDLSRRLRRSRKDTTS